MAIPTLRGDLIFRLLAYKFSFSLYCTYFIIILTALNCNSKTFFFPNISSSITETVSYFSLCPQCLALLFAHLIIYKFRKGLLRV